MKYIKYTCLTYVFYLLYASLIPRNVLCLEGVEIPSNGQERRRHPLKSSGGGEGGRWLQVKILELHLENKKINTFTLIIMNYLQ